MTERTDAATEPARVPRSRRGALLGGLLAIVLAAAAGLYWYRHEPDRPVAAALAGETGATTIVYRRGWFGSGDLVFDLASVGGEQSMADVTRRLLKAAEALQDRDFGRVYLAYRGRERFYLAGAYFKRLGQERAWQNPVYTIRTLPENVRKLDGTPAFATVSGGWLGVLGQQLDDSNRFHQQWWVDDALTSVKP